MYPEPSQGVLALILGIIGLCVFQPVAPFAWVIGNREVRGADAGRRNPSNRGLGLAGKVLGIIGTVVLILEVLFVVVAIITLVATGTASYTNTTY
jgi:hypothetical protein